MDRTHMDITIIYIWFNMEDMYMITIYIYIYLCTHGLIWRICM